MYHVAIPTNVSLLSLCSKRRNRAAGLQRMTNKFEAFEMLFLHVKKKIDQNNCMIK